MSDNYTDSEFLYEYKKNDEEDEIYDYTRSKEEFFCRRKEKDEWFYARTQFGEEYLPSDRRITFQNSLPAYPVTLDAKVLFPKNEHGDEMWLYFQDETVVSSSYGRLERYPKTAKGREIYPIIDDEKFYELILDECGFARNENGKFYYPLDWYGYEYIYNIDKFKEHVNDFEDYPLAVDGTVLVPIIEDNAFFVSHFKTQVSEANLKDKLKPLEYKTEYYLTEIKPKDTKKRLLDGQYFYVVSLENDKLGPTLEIPSSLEGTLNLPSINEDKKSNSRRITFVLYYLLLLLVLCVMVFLVFLYKI